MRSALRRRRNGFRRRIRREARRSDRHAERLACVTRRLIGEPLVRIGLDASAFVVGIKEVNAALLRFRETLSRTIGDAVRAELEQTSKRNG